MSEAKPYKIEVSGKTKEDLVNSIKEIEDIVDMKNFVLIVSGVLNSSRPPTGEPLAAPSLSILEQNADTVVIRIERNDPRGSIISWQIGKNEDLSGDVQGITVRNGSIPDTQDLVLNSNSYPIESFYIQATENANNLESSSRAPLFVLVEDPQKLLNPNAITTPLNGAVNIVFSEDPNADRFEIEQKVGDNYVLLNSSITSPHIVSGLTNETEYTFRITAVSESLVYLSSSSEVTEIPDTPDTLPTPTDIIFTDQGGGDLQLEIVTNQVGVTFEVNRNSILVYSGNDNIIVVPDHGQGNSYQYSVKISKDGFLDSEFYTKGYTYQPVASNTLEDYGGNSFYVPLFGVLNYTPLGNGTSRVTYTGSNNIFNNSFVGKWLEPSRINQNPVAYPTLGRNYMPNVLGVIYSKVVSIEDGKNLIVDFEYNGGNRDSPTPSNDADGTFFFDNKEALNTWFNTSNRPVLHASSGQIYATMGMPSVNCVAGENYNLTTDIENQAVLHIMGSDSFTVDENGDTVSICPSFVSQYGLKTTMFILPDSGEVNIDFQWQIVGPTYTFESVQYGNPYNIFYGGTSVNSCYGLKRIVSKNPYVIRDLMESSLGFLRKGANYVMPGQGSSNGGGKNDGTEITDFSIFRFEGSWITKNTASFKGRNNGGILLEWIGPGQFIDMDELAATKFDVSIKWHSNRSIETNSLRFNWYLAAGQYWTGGLRKVANPNDKIQIGDNEIWLGNGGDWEMIGQKVPITSNIVSSFNRILSTGDIIQNSVTDSQNGLVRKISNTEFVTWGWAVQVGDILSYSGQSHLVTRVDRYPISWIDYKPSTGEANSYINCFKITLATPIADPLSSVVFTVESSILEYLLDNSYRELEYRYEANTSFSNLLYIDDNLNTRFENIDIYGDIRATSPGLDNLQPLWRYSSIAEWTNVNLINRDGTVGYSNRNEYQPRYLRTRQLLTGQDSYRWKVSGGRFGFHRDDTTYAQIEFSDNTHIVKNNRSGERIILYEPILNGPIKIGVNNSEAFSRVQLGLTDGNTVDFSDVELNNNLEIFGNGKVIVDGMTTINRNETLFYGIEIWDNFSSPRNIEIEGDSGTSSIAVLRPVTIGEITITLTNWTLKPNINAPNGFTTYQDVNDPNYCSYISINGNCLP